MMCGFYMMDRTEKTVPPPIVKPSQETFSSALVKPSGRSSFMADVTDFHRHVLPYCLMT